MISRRGAAWTTAALALAIAGCAGAGARPTRDGAAPSTLYPLAEGDVWSYDVVDDHGSRSLGITRVVRRAGDLAEVSSNRSAPIVYRVTDEGIALPTEDAWLLKAPIAVGASWAARSGRVARVVAVDEAVRVSAGDFVDCVHVEERGGAVAVDTTFCPHVGPVRVVVTVDGGPNGEMARTEATLRGLQLAEPSAHRAPR